MGEFREEFIADIRTALTVGGYHADDFNLSQTSNDKFKILEISYRFHPGFWSRIQIRFREERTVTVFPMAQPSAPEPEGTIHLFVSPGEILSNEHEICSSKSQIVRELEQWVGRIDADLRAIPLNRKVEEQQKRLDELTAQFADVPEGYFSAEEAEELKARLDAFEERFAESIREATEDKDEADRRIASLHEEIEMLKRQVELLNRKGWTKSVMVRVANWLRDPTNRQLLQSGAEVAKTILLPPGSSRAN